MDLEFRGEIWFWRGPAPWYFITVPEEESLDIKAMSAELTYGWGMIPVIARIGSTKWETALFEKDGRYIVPVKVAVRKLENLELGDTVGVRLETATKPRPTPAAGRSRNASDQSTRSIATTSMPSSSVTVLTGR